MDVNTSNDSANAEIETKTDGTEQQAIETPKVPTLEELEAIKAEAEKTKRSYERALEESKKYKSRAQDAERKLVEKEGTVEDKINLLVQQNEELKERISTERISAALQKEAIAHGCTHWSHLALVGDTSMIEYDEETESVNGVRDFFEQHKNNSEYSLYFSKPAKQVFTNNKTPELQDAGLDYKKDPLAFLTKIRKEKGVYSNEYKNAKELLIKEGFIR